MEEFFIRFPKGGWADVHSVEPIPEADRDSTGPQQMWIWAGANIAPVNWALGALGIILKLGLWETIAVGTRTLGGSRCQHCYGSLR